jgi:hypothetical protein
MSRWWRFSTPFFNMNRRWKPFTDPNFELDLISLLAFELYYLSPSLSRSVLSYPSLSLALYISLSHAVALCSRVGPHPWHTTNGDPSVRPHCHLKCALVPWHTRGSTLWVRRPYTNGSEVGWQQQQRGNCPTTLEVKSSCVLHRMFYRMSEDVFDTN